MTNHRVYQKVHFPVPPNPPHPMRFLRNFFDLLFRLLSWNLEQGSEMTMGESLQRFNVIMNLPRNAGVTVIMSLSIGVYWSPSFSPFSMTVTQTKKDIWAV